MMIKTILKILGNYWWVTAGRTTTYETLQMSCNILTPKPTLVRVLAN